jgi:hypothetical protein
MSSTMPKVKRPFCIKNLSYKLEILQTIELGYLVMLQFCGNEEQNDFFQKPNLNNIKEKLLISLFRGFQMLVID